MKARLIPCLVLCGLLLPSIGHTQTYPAAVDCAGERLTRALKTICEDMSLMELTRLTDDLTGTLEKRLSGAEWNALVDTQRSFLDQRGGCSSADPVTDCVRQLTNLRRLALEAALENPASILDEVTRYERVDVPFFVRYGHRLEGRQVRVYGCFILDPGLSPQTRLTGTIRERCQDLDAPSVHVIFDQMNATRVNFLSQSPTSRWRGHVEMLDGQAVLLMSLSDL